MSFLNFIFGYTDKMITWAMNITPETIVIDVAGADESRICSR